MCLAICPIKEETMALGRSWASTLSMWPTKAKLIAIVASDAAEAILGRMKQHPHGVSACIIGEVRTEPRGIVSMKTGFGSTRIVDMLTGDQLPRIC